MTNTTFNHNPILRELTKIIGALRRAVFSLDCTPSEIHIQRAAAETTVERLRPIPARIHHVMDELQP